MTFLNNENLTTNMKKLINPWLSVPGYCCPGCSPNNEKGLRLEFWEDGDDIVSIWHPEAHFQSWKDTLHGGIQCLMLDEIAGWVVCRKLQTMGVTSKMDTKYHHPMSISGGPIELRARIQRQLRQVAIIEAELRQRGELCTTAVATYFCASPETTRTEYGFEGCKAEDEV